MLQTDADIEQALSRPGYQGIRLDPFIRANLGPASYDVTLSPFIRRPAPHIGRIDLANVPEGHTVAERVDGPIVVEPGQFLLASTIEHVSLGHDWAARYEGRSSLGRLGLASHITAAFIDPGFSGNVTLEIANHAPWELVLHPGMRIGQLCFFQLPRDVDRPYAVRGHYQGQEGPVESRFRLDP